MIVPDAFYWGERRLQYEQPPPELATRLAALKPEQSEYVVAMNTYLRERVHDLNTRLSFAGTSWLGIVNHDDRQSVAVLAAMPEVDATRLGSVGLSGGGHRATTLRRSFMMRRISSMSRCRRTRLNGWRLGYAALPASLRQAAHQLIVEADAEARTIGHRQVSGVERLWRVDEIGSPRRLAECELVDLDVR